MKEIPFKSEDDMIRYMENNDIMCMYCTISYECRGLTLGPDGPIYPPCADGLSMKYVDFNAFIEDYRNEDI